MVEGTARLAVPHQHAGHAKCLAPLISLWLDMLVLRLMNQGRPSSRPVWFILDELATLQRLPQLHTAITENAQIQQSSVCSVSRDAASWKCVMGTKAEIASLATEKLPVHERAARSGKWIAQIGDKKSEDRESRTNGSSRNRQGRGL